MKLLSILFLLALSFAPATRNPGFELSSKNKGMNTVTYQKQRGINKEKGAQAKELRKEQNRLLLNKQNCQTRQSEMVEKEADRRATELKHLEVLRLQAENGELPDFQPIEKEDEIEETPQSKKKKSRNNRKMKFGIDNFEDFDKISEESLQSLQTTTSSSNTVVQTHDPELWETFTGDVSPVVSPSISEKEPNHAQNRSFHAKNGVEVSCLDERFCGFYELNFDGGYVSFVNGRYALRTYPDGWILTNKGNENDDQCYLYLDTNKLIGENLWADTTLKDFIAVTISPA